MYTLHVGKFISPHHDICQAPKQDLVFAQCAMCLCEKALALAVRVCEIIYVTFARWPTLLHCGREAARTCRMTTTGKKSSEPVVPRGVH